MSYIWIAIGGALGSSLRHFIGDLVTTRYGSGFPLRTMFVNITGSFVIGILATLLAERHAHPMWSLFLVTGFLGGYTTFSAYSLDAMRLFQSGNWLAGLFYVIGSVLLSLLACALGIALAGALR